MQRMYEGLHIPKIIFGFWELSVVIYITMAKGNIEM